MQIAQYEAKTEENINRHETAEREIEEVKLEKCSLYMHALILVNWVSATCIYQDKSGRVRQRAIADYVVSGHSHKCFQVATLFSIIFFFCLFANR